MCVNRIMELMKPSGTELLHNRSGRNKIMNVN